MFQGGRTLCGVYLCLGVSVCDLVLVCGTVHSFAETLIN